MTRTLFIGRGPDRREQIDPLGTSAAPAPVPESFGSNDLAAAFRVSLRQLQWWDERRVIYPRHEKHRRIYTRGDALLVAVIAALRRRGFSLQNIRRVVKKLKDPEALAGRLVLDDETMMLVAGADAEEVYVFPGGRDATPRLDALAAVMQMKEPAVVIELSGELAPLLLRSNRRLGVRK